MSDLLHHRINRSLLALALAASALGSTLMASVSGGLVLQATLNEAQKQARAVERDLSSTITSFLPLYEVQRQLQLAASSRELSSALLIAQDGQVLAASDSALVGRKVAELGPDDDLGDLPRLLQGCLSAPLSSPCGAEERANVFLGPLPLIGGDRLLRFHPTPLALERVQAIDAQGLLVIEVDLHPYVAQALQLMLQVFLAGLVPLFITAAVLVLVVRRHLLPELISLAQTDGLSGVLNRRAFLEAAEQRLLLNGKSDQPYVVALVDVDYFKAINDTYGHAAGDEVIRRMADFLLAAVRRSDLVGRMGGDEFALLVSATAPQAYELLERLRQQVSAHAWTMADGAQPQLSLSIGMAELGSPARNDLAELLQAADAALYVAKDLGRNQVIDLQRQSPAGWKMKPA